MEIRRLAIECLRQLAAVAPAVLNPADRDGDTV
ncbi:Thymidylate synthase thyX [Mycobacterium tuberculosis]|nr:Thymidylate synthase thyX [Mycobacterium tuberculosis]